MIVFFGWVLFIWLLITVYSDLFRRQDVGGWGKALWIVFTLLLPFLGTFVYLITEGRAMQDRQREDAQRAKADMDNYVRSVASNGASSTTDQIARAKEMLDSGAITSEEYATLKQKALAR
jgi:hypothetical protein